MNWFLVANTTLTFAGGMWYLINGQTPLGLLQMTFTVSNIIFLWIGIHTK